MTVTMGISGATAFALQAAVGAYSDEAYTNAKKLTGTSLVSSNPEIDKNTETFVGQMRWFKPMNPTIQVASLTSSTDATGSTYSSDFSQYIKTVRTHGATKINMQQVVTQQDGLAKIGRDFGETHAQDEHNAILAVLKGVAITEALCGAANGSTFGVNSAATGLGGQTFNNDVKDAKFGFYVDLGAALPIVAATSTIQGAARAEGFLQAFGMAFKDYEPPFAYLITSPEVFASMRSANLVDQTKVTEANVEFETIFGGKFRLISTRASQGMSATELTRINTGAGVDIVGTKTSFIVLPGALAFERLAVPEPVEMQRNAKAYLGGGSTDMWHRWGYVVHPKGYSWMGTSTAFPSDADYKAVMVAGAMEVLGGATVIGQQTSGVWHRKTDSALSLGILPVFHS